MTNKTKTDRTDFWLVVLLFGLIPVILLIFQLTGYSILDEDSLIALSENTKLQRDTLVIAERFSERAARSHLEMMGNLAVLYAVSLVVALLTRLALGYFKNKQLPGYFSQNNGLQNLLFLFGVSAIVITAAFYWGPPFQWSGSRLARAIRPGISDIAYHALFVGVGVMGFYSFVMAVFAKIRSKAD